MLRRAVVGRRGPGLIGAAARTAVVAGTATAVSGRVRERRARSEQHPPRYAESAQGQGNPGPSDAIGDETLAKLERLSQLRRQGVLTEGEFTEQKARLLGA